MGLFSKSTRDKGELLMNILAANKYYIRLLDILKVISPLLQSPFA